MRDGWYFHTRDTHLFIKFQGGKVVQYLNLNLSPGTIYENHKGVWPTIQELEKKKPLSDVNERYSFIDLMSSHGKSVTKEYFHFYTFYLDLKQDQPFNDDSIYELEL